MRRRAVPGGGAKAARLPAESAAAASSAGTAATRERTVSMPSPARRVAGSAHGGMKRTACPWTRPNALWGGSVGVEPGALHACEGAVGVGDGGDQGGEAGEPARLVAVGERGMEAQRRKAADVQAAGAEVAFRVGAAEGAAGAPQAPGRSGAVPGRGRVCAVGLRVPALRCGQGEEGAGLVEGGAEGACPDAVADEVEQVAVLAGRRIGPPPAGRPRGAQAHEQGPPLGAVEVAGDPVAALPAAVGKVAPAHGLGAFERIDREAARPDPFDRPPIRDHAMAILEPIEAGTDEAPASSAAPLPESPASLPSPAGPPLSELEFTGCEAVCMTLI